MTSVVASADRYSVWVVGKDVVIMNEEKTCKDCIHRELCNVHGYIDADECACFKDKSRYIELPCAVGDKVYKIWNAGKHGKSVAEFVLTSISQISRGVWVFKYSKCQEPCISYQGNLEYIGKTVFLTKEDAEKVLKGGAE